MSTTHHHSGWLRPGLGVFQIFIGVGAIAGGWGLMGDPSGASMGLPQTSLDGSPFATYFIPGLFLFTVNGLGTLAGSIITLKSFRYAGEVAIGLGVILMLWIVIQAMVIGMTSFLQPFYFVVGVLEAWGGLLLRTGVAAPASSAKGKDGP